MDLTQGARKDLVSRREALTLLGAIAAVRSAGAAEQAIMQPVSLDHVNIRVSNTARSLRFPASTCRPPGTAPGSARSRC